MAASRFRPPKVHTSPQSPQPRSGHKGVEPDTSPVLRVSRTGIRNMPRTQQLALRKERKADPEGEGVPSWRRRQWIGAMS